MESLTTKQKLFVEEYLANPNATQAAIAAGYSSKTAGSQGQRLLKNVEIQKKINIRVETAIVTADEVLNSLKTLAQSAERDADKIKSWELLGKHLKLFTDKQEISGKDGGAIEVNQVIRPKVEE